MKHPLKMPERIEIVRARVVDCGPDAFSCSDADGREWTVEYVCGTADSPHDSSYLRALLVPGIRVNLVDVCAGVEGSLRPRFIVAEPDYLVNVTAVAGCMADYGDSPLVGLMRKLAPAPNSEAIQMGNFAGRLLDEALHGESRSKPYADSVRDFFRSAATGIMALGEGFDGRRFHGEAQRQQANIRAAVQHGIPERAPGFKASETMVEPSFFCEVLGLQGRMDCLTLDGSVVVEQKSGKGAFGSRSTETPVLRREHYAQLLLYRAALRYGHPGSDAAAFLLYSKYSRGVVDAGRSEPLLQGAMELRNRLAVEEMSYARDGFGMLGRLSPDDMNLRGVYGALWTRYQRPQLAGVLSVVSSADETARAYYMRMMRFVAMEHVLAKLGNGTAEGAGFASAWLCGADEKRAAGDMLDGMHLLSPSESHEGKVTEIRLALSSGVSGDVSNFRAADIVLLYSYDSGSEPDIRRALPLRCVVRSLGSDSLVLELRTPQSDARVLRRDARRLWAIEHDFIDSGSDALYRGLHSLLGAGADRRDLVLGRRRPRVDEGEGARGNYGAFKDVVAKAMRARDIFLVVGPPGTGKTSHGLVSILLEELSRPDASVLLTAYTNRAVDEICSKLEEHGVDYVRAGSASACEPFCRTHTIDAVVASACGLADVRARLGAARVYVGTVAAVNARVELLSMHGFSLAIVDEASQILEPHLAGIFGAMRGEKPAVERFVLIGDHKQLPAVVRQKAEDSVVGEECLRSIGIENCRMSFFERMIRRYGSDPSLACMLTRQGRMHPDIAGFPSRMFYGGRLCPVPLPHQAAPGGGRVRFVPVEPVPDDVSDKVNSAEAAEIARVVSSVCADEGAGFDPAFSVGVIVPYRNQIAAVRAALVKSGVKEADYICVDTVERYQGSQRKHIVFGLTVRNTSQLAFLTDSTITDSDGSEVDRRLNVALTRAREYLTIIGNPAVLSHNRIYAALMDYCVKKR